MPLCMSLWRPFSFYLLHSICWRIQACGHIIQNVKSVYFNFKSLHSLFVSTLFKSQKFNVSSEIHCGLLIVSPYKIKIKN